MPITIDNEKIEFFSECDTSHPFPPTLSFTRTGAAKIDMIYPGVSFPSNKIYKQVGEEAIRKLVQKHHELVRESKIAFMYPKDDEKFNKATRIIEDFFVQMLGGGDIYTAKQGHPRLRDRHFPFEINEEGRDIWLICFKKALKQNSFPKELLPEIWDWVEALSLRMVNRRTTMSELKRYPFEKICKYFDN
jgi:hemoglobin